MLMGQVEDENPAGLPCEERPWGLEEILVSVEFQRPRGRREPKQNTGKRDCGNARGRLRQVRSEKAEGRWDSGNGCLRGVA